MSATTTELSAASPVVDSEAPLPSSTPSSSVPKTRKKNTRRKEMKDPAAPKRPLSSFFLFADEERPKVMAELGNISVGEVGKEMGRRWAELDKDKKGKYETIQAKAKAKYEEEMKNYQPSKEFLEMKAEQDRKRLTGTEHMAEYFSFLKDNWMKVVVEQQMVEETELQEMLWQMWSKGKVVNTKTKRRKLNKVKKAAESNKPLTAFGIFQEELKEKLKLAGVTFSDDEVSGIVMERWNTLDQDLKMGYEKLVEERKAGQKEVGGGDL